jgi:hypothetical protein
MYDGGRAAGTGVTLMCSALNVAQSRLSLPLINDLKWQTIWRQIWETPYGPERFVAEARNRSCAGHRA